MKEPTDEPKWELCWEFDEGINAALAIDVFVPGNEMALADAGNSRVVIYASKGHQKETIDIPQSKFPSNCLVRDLLLQISDKTL